MVGWTCLTVYQPQKIYIDGDHAGFFWFSVLYLWSEIVTYLIHSSISDLDATCQLGPLPTKHLTYHNIHRTERVKCSLEEIDLAFPRSHVAS